MAIADLRNPQAVTVASTTIESDTSAKAGGMTLRVVLLCLALAVFFGYVIPIVDVKLSNTFVGAQHLPPGAVGVLLVLLLILTPLSHLLSRRFSFSRSELLTVSITCLCPTLVSGQGGKAFLISLLNGWTSGTSICPRG
jgi:hypothetical protein